MFRFEVTKKLGEARLSRLDTPHGPIDGPFFQFVATRAAIRGLVFPEDLEQMNVQIVLANTYHLHLQPGEDIVAEAGGLHDFMQWQGPMTTDSGGYQVFSLGKNVKYDEDGVTFRSHLDGKALRLTPESAMEIQRKLGPDIVMPLDVCTSFGATRDEVAAAVEQTHEWAKRCKAAHEGNDKQALYGIVQGGVFLDLRERSIEQLRALNFFGYSIGGELQEAGEGKKIAEVVPKVATQLPEDKPRYLMGYGMPEDIVEAVRGGVDQFDCVLPVRNARHGQVMEQLNVDYLKQCLVEADRPVDRTQLYSRYDITKAAFKSDHSDFSPSHPVIQKPYTKAYVHHLMRAETPAGMRLTVLHNIHFYAELMRAIRDIIGYTE